MIFRNYTYLGDHLGKKKLHCGGVLHPGLTTFPFDLVSFGLFARLDLGLFDVFFFLSFQQKNLPRIWFGLFLCKTKGEDVPNNQVAFCEHEKIFIFCLPHNTFTVSASSIWPHAPCRDSYFNQAVKTKTGLKRLFNQRKNSNH